MTTFLLIFPTWNLRVLAPTSLKEAKKALTACSASRSQSYGRYGVGTAPL
jgi:hypothetical protein